MAPGARSSPPERRGGGLTLSPDELSEIAAVLDAAQPYLDDLVLVGGWAHRLFRLHPWARPRDFVPLSTDDVDFAVPRVVPQRGQRPLSELLQAADFKPVHKSTHTESPLVRYEGGSGLLVEFLANLEGSPIDRAGKTKDVVAVENAGITAELLRYLYPLQLRPWRPPARSDGRSILAEVRVANPVTYLFQKILVHGQRGSRKAANDVLYLADTADLFGDDLDRLSEEWSAHLVGEVHPKHVAKFRRAAEALVIPSAVHTDAAKIATSIGRPRRAEVLAQTIRLVVERVFPGPD